ncbi:hypothetical protein F5Y11DRAFT_345890 [Daldinia sp. FL1419]|nr:hypothetical protein F5Y11DRAFT_345890 [Daldinia sp. FL1419]
MDMESFAVPGPDRTGPIRRSNISAKRIPVAVTTLTHCCHYRETESQRRDFPRYTLLELVLTTLISLSTWRGWSILGAIVVSILATLLSVFEVIRLGAEAIRLGAKTIAIGAELALVYMESELSAAKAYSSTQYTPHVDQDEAPLPPPTPPLMPSGQQLVGQTLDILSDQPRFSTSLPPEAPLPLPPPLLQTPHIHTDDIQQDPSYSYQERADIDIEHDHEEIIEKKIMFEQSKSLESESPEPERLLPPLPAHPIPAIVSWYTASSPAYD